MRPRLLLLFPATSYRIDAFVEAAAELPLDLVLGCNLPAAAVRFGLPVVQVDFDSAERTLARLEKAALRIDAVLAVDERSALLAAQLAEAHGKQAGFHEVAGVQAAADKRLMRARLSQAGVVVPRHQVLAAGQSMQTLGEPVRYPCVVKPPMLSGSQGVLRADDADQLEVAVARVRAILQRHPSELRRQSGFFELIIEDYVEGEELAVEGLMARGVLQLFAIFDKPDALAGPTFEETIYVTPSRQPAALQETVVEVAERAAVALGLVHGPIHAELRLGPNGPVLIEIAGRSIGGLCSRVFARLLGSHGLETRLLCNAIGRAPMPLPLAWDEASGVMMIPVPRSGVLRGVDGLEQARAITGVEAVTIAVEPGEAIRKLPEGARYLGFIFAHAGTPAAVEEALRRAHALLRFHWKTLLDQATVPLRREHS